MTDDNQTVSVPSGADGVDYLSAMLTGHRLALAVQDVWRAASTVLIRHHLVEVQSEMRPVSFSENISSDVLISNLCEFFQDPMAGRADEVFSHYFVEQSHTEIITAVANTLPNNIAANYDLEMLRRSLREIVDDFANRAKDLPRWKAKRFRKRLHKKRAKIDARSGVVRDAFTGVPAGFKLAAEEMENDLKRLMQTDKWLTKGDKKKVVQFARNQVGLLIGDLQNLAKDAEGKLVDAVFSSLAARDMTVSKSDGQK